MSKILSARLKNNKNTGFSDTGYIKSELKRLKEIAVEEIDLDLIDIVSNVRIEEEDDDLNDLSESIKVLGVLNPILVKSIGSRYRIIFGHRRFKACKLLKKKTIPAFIKDSIKSDEDIHTIQLAENIHRRNLSAEGLEKAVQAYIDLGYSQVQIAAILNKSKSWVSGVLAAGQIRNNHSELLQQYIEIAKEIPTSSLSKLAGLNKPEQEKILKKALKAGGSRSSIQKAKEEIVEAKPQKPQLTIIIYGDEKNSIGRIKFKMHSNEYIEKIKNQLNEIGIKF